MLMALSCFLKVKNFTVCIIYMTVNKYGETKYLVKDYAKRKFKYITIMITDCDILVNQGVPSAATIDDLPSEVTDKTITLKWSKPQDNGKEITQYTVYQRIVTYGKPGEWINLKNITDVSVRKFPVELESGKVYEFVVTATNEHGESVKENGKIMRVKASNKGNLFLIAIITHVSFTCKILSIMTCNLSETLT